MSWTYNSAIIGPLIVYYWTMGGPCIVSNDTLYHHTSLRVVYHCKEKAALRHSSRGFHTRTRLSSLLKLKLDSLLKTTGFYSVAIQSRRARHQFKRRCLWVGVIGSIRNGCRDTRCSTYMRPCDGLGKHRGS
ncbi:hypothetical protein TNCV_3035441 [Trichonephila clavipes]|nr:hypothetical protein TNCV_3035441 [Trichonephila clavipes]